MLWVIVSGFITHCQVTVHREVWRALEKLVAVSYRGLKQLLHLFRVLQISRVHQNSMAHAKEMHVWNPRLGLVDFTDDLADLIRVTFLDHSYANVLSLLRKAFGLV